MMTVVEQFWCDMREANTAWNIQYYGPDPENDDAPAEAAHHDAFCEAQYLFCDAEAGIHKRIRVLSVRRLKKQGCLPLLSHQKSQRKALKHLQRQRNKLT